MCIRDSSWSDDRSGTIGERMGERMGNVRERAGRAADRVQGAMDSTRETLKQAADSTRGAWRQAADSSRETVEQTAESVRSGATRAFEITREQAGMARERVDRLLHEQPLMLGALGLAAGAIIGALLPTSEHEDRFLGEMRDKAVKDVAQKSRAGLESALDQVAPSASAERRNAADEDSRDRPASRPH